MGSISTPYHNGSAVIEVTTPSVPSDELFVVPPPDGTFVTTEDGGLFLRVKGIWRQIALVD